MSQDHLKLAEKLLPRSDAPMSDEVAKYFSSWAFSPEVEERIDALSHKANDGTLEDAEGRELQAFIAMNDLVSLMRLRALTALRQRGSAA